MVSIPQINNQQTANRKQSSVLQSIGITILLDLLESQKEAYFIDVENGVNPLGALAFRSIMGPPDALKYLLGQPLIPTPTVQEVIDDPITMIRRLNVLTNVDVRAAIAEDPSQESAVMSGLQARRQSGSALAQAIANAVNADKDVRQVFDTHLINARENLVKLAAQATEAAVGGLDEGIGRLISSLSEFFIEAPFAKPRRSGDNKRVSKEKHEFDYLSGTIIDSYGNEVLGVPSEIGFTHLDVALLLLGVNFDRPNNGITGIGVGTELPAEIATEISEQGLFNIPSTYFDATNFSYGDFIDSYNMRKLLAELKKLVQSTRVDNVGEFIRSTGTTRPEYISNILSRLAPNGYISLAANEFVLNQFGNPTKPVRRYIDTTNAAEAVFLGNNPAVNPAGTLITFTPRVAQTPQG